MHFPCELGIKHFFISVTPLILLFLTPIRLHLILYNEIDSHIPSYPARKSLLHPMHATLSLIRAKLKKTSSLAQQQQAKVCNSF